MITGKIIEKAEEEEEDSYASHSSSDYNEDFDFDQYKDISEDCLDNKKIHNKHLSTLLRDKAVRKRERCEFCNLLIPGNRAERHREECGQPQAKKLVLDVKSIKFAERVNKKVTKNTDHESFDRRYTSLNILVRDSKREDSMPSIKNSRSKPRDFKIRSQSKKGTSALKYVKRDINLDKSLKRVKRPSTKEAINRDNSITKISDGIDSSSCQFNTAYPIKTPIQHSTKHSETDSNLTYGLSKTNESFKNANWSSGSKAQSSTIGFSSSTNNTTGYSKDFTDIQFRNSKYLPN